MSLLVSDSGEQMNCLLRRNRIAFLNALSFSLICASAVATNTHKIQKALFISKLYTIHEKSFSQPSEARRPRVIDTHLNSFYPNRFICSKSLSFSGCLLMCVALFATTIRCRSDRVKFLLFAINFTHLERCNTNLHC